MKTVTKIQNSSQIESVGYDPETKSLFITFKPKMAEYQYDNVHEDIYEGLLAAESAGKYVNAEIKGKYNFKIVE
jgi:lysyl-tRNA synthetase class 2